MKNNLEVLLFYQVDVDLFPVQTNSLLTNQNPSCIYVSAKILK
uniref:Uncharacterized protein n=1 Tax=Anguilla anguilla TaxID=7936 RepID=A0A0E9QVV3_ANGAN